MKRIFPHLAAPVCGLAAGWTVYCALDLLIIVGMGLLDQYPRFTPFLAVNLLLAGGTTLALTFLTLRLWYRHEPRRWPLILYAAEAVAALVVGMHVCATMLALLRWIF